MRLGGAIMLAVISAVAFATILAVVAGPDPRVVQLARARLLRQRHQAGPGVGAPGGQRRPDLGIRHRRGRDPAGDLRAEPERGVPRRARLRGRRLRQPAGDPLQPLLEAVHHLRRGLGDLRRSQLRGLPGLLLAGRVRVAHLAVPERGLRRGSRCRTPASSPSRSASSAAGSARSCRRSLRGSTPNWRCARSPGWVWRKHLWN